MLLLLGFEALIAVGLVLRETWLVVPGLLPWSGLWEGLSLELVSSPASLGRLAVVRREDALALSTPVLGSRARPKKIVTLWPWSPGGFTLLVPLGDGHCFGKRCLFLHPVGQFGLKAFPKQCVLGH